MSYLPVRKSRKTPKGTVTIRSNSLKRSIQKTERERKKEKNEKENKHSKCFQEENYITSLKSVEQRKLKTELNKCV